MTDQVLIDAAKLLRRAASQTIKLANVTACTPEHELKVKSEILANINAAIARIQP